jgi:hypothetical protein
MGQPGERRRLGVTVFLLALTAAPSLHAQAAIDPNVAPRASALER